MTDAMVWEGKSRPAGFLWSARYLVALSVFGFATAIHPPLLDLALTPFMTAASTEGIELSALPHVPLSISPAVEVRQPVPDTTQALIRGIMAAVGLAGTSATAAFSLYFGRARHVVTRSSLRVRLPLGEYAYPLAEVNQVRLERTPFGVDVQVFLRDEEAPTTTMVGLTVDDAQAAERALLPLPYAAP